MILDNYFVYLDFVERGERHYSVVSKDIADCAGSLKRLNTYKFIYDVISGGRHSELLARRADRNMRRLSSNLFPITIGAHCKKFFIKTRAKRFVIE